MSIPPFPLVGVHLQGMAASEAIKMFLDQRPDERWVLLGEHAAQGDDQLWTAWIQDEERTEGTWWQGRSMPNPPVLGQHTFPKPSLGPAERRQEWILHLPLAEGRANDRVISTDSHLNRSV